MSKPYNPTCSICGKVATQHYSNYNACQRSVADVARRETLLWISCRAGNMGNMDVTDWIDQIIAGEDI